MVEPSPPVKNDVVVVVPLAAAMVTDGTATTMVVDWVVYGAVVPSETVIVCVPAKNGGIVNVPDRTPVAEIARALVTDTLSMVIVGVKPPTDVR